MESILIYKLPQADGSFNVKERIVADSGKVYMFDYSCNNEVSLTAKRQRNVALVTLTESTVEEPQSDDTLASLAIATKAILDQSPKLNDPEIQQQLQQLVDAVKLVAGSNPDEGTTATTLVYELLARPNMNKYPQLKDSILTALNNIQTITNGVL